MSSIEITPPAPESLPVETQAKPEDSGRRKAIVGTGLGMVALSVTAHFAQKYSIMESWPDMPRAIGKSMQHPVLGYAGALIVNRGPTRNSLLAAGVATTVLNAGAEAGQAVVYDSDRDPGEFLAHNSLFETLKDYSFALGGMAVYRVLSSTRKKRGS